MVKRLFVLAVFSIAIFGFTLPGLALEPKVIGWDDLVPEPVAYENPFEGLSPEQLSSLRKLLRFQQDAGNSNIITSDEAAALRTQLKADGLDIEGLFEQRKVIMEARQKAVTMTKDEMVGQLVRMPGYLLPLEIKDQKAIEFLLVPTVGACIHSPTPPANQMVYVQYAEGFPIKELYTPVWISGKILADSRVETVRYVDGERPVSSSYTMKADVVIPY